MAMCVMLSLIISTGMVLAKPFSINNEAGNNIPARRSTQTYIPTWCKDKNLQNCQQPTWNVGECYNFAQLALDNAISSYMIPHPLSCTVYDWPNCNTQGYTTKFCPLAQDTKCQGPYAGKASTTWNAGTVKLVTEYDYNDVASSIICSMPNT